MDTSGRESEGVTSQNGKDLNFAVSDIPVEQDMSVVQADGSEGITMADQLYEREESSLSRSLSESNPEKLSSGDELLSSRMQADENVTGDSSLRTELGAVSNRRQKIVTCKPEILEFLYKTERRTRTFYAHGYTTLDLGKDGAIGEGACFQALSEISSNAIDVVQSVRLTVDQHPNLVIVDDSSKLTKEQLDSVLSNKDLSTETYEDALRSFMKYKSAVTHFRFANSKACTSNSDFNVSNGEISGLQIAANMPWDKDNSTALSQLLMLHCAISVGCGVLPLACGPFGSAILIKVHSGCPRLLKIVKESVSQKFLRTIEKEMNINISEYPTKQVLITEDVLEKHKEYFSTITVTPGCTLILAPGSLYFGADLGTNIVSTFYFTCVNWKVLDSLNYTCCPLRIHNLKSSKNFLNMLNLVNYYYSKQHLLLKTGESHAPDAKYGVFAKNYIEKSSNISLYFGEDVPLETCQDFQFCVKLEKRCIDGRHSSSFSSTINSSKNNYNVQLREAIYNDQTFVLVTALRNIYPGEELIYVYNQHMQDPSRLCRAIIIPTRLVSRPNFASHLLNMNPEPHYFFPKDNVKYNEFRQPLNDDSCETKSKKQANEKRKKTPGGVLEQPSSEDVGRQRKRRTPTTESKSKKPNSVATSPKAPEGSPKASSSKNVCKKRKSETTTTDSESTKPKKQKTVAPTTAERKSKTLGQATEQSSSEAVGIQGRKAVSSSSKVLGRKRDITISKNKGKPKPQESESIKNTAFRVKMHLNKLIHDTTVKAANRMLEKEETISFTSLMQKVIQLLPHIDPDCIDTTNLKLGSKEEFFRMNDIRKNKNPQNNKVNAKYYCSYCKSTFSKTEFYRHIPTTHLYKRETGDF